MRKKKKEVQEAFERYLGEILAGDLAEASAIDMRNSILWGRNWKEKAAKE